MKKLLLVFIIGLLLFGFIKNTKSAVVNTGIYNTVKAPYPTPVPTPTQPQQIK